MCLTIQNITMKPINNNVRLPIYILHKYFLTFLLNTLTEVNNLSDDGKLFQRELPLN